jgi:hypothetical protein
MAYWSLYCESLDWYMDDYRTMKDQACVQTRKQYWDARGEVCIQFLELRGPIAARASLKYQNEVRLNLPQTLLS